MVEPFTQSFKIEGSNFINAGKASTEIKTILKQLGINSETIRRVAIASYEAEMNVVMYARCAEFVLEINPKQIKIVASDEGPGISDVELAMREGYSTSTDEMREMGFGAGMGLPNIKKNSDVFNIESVVGKGTKLEIIININ
ncbi:MAG: ATP-binding protein [Bacteroidetes bacterium]|nr:ATP-binding protein [Bacteroidota bacterium]MBU1422938.1 ATP-binding protein [Bacteroidota bacterium]MBU2636621.1 ATP-binding protein [Bacteroidota bacterium]